MDIPIDPIADDVWASDAAVDGASLHLRDAFVAIVDGGEGGSPPPHAGTSCRAGGSWT